MATQILQKWGNTQLGDVVTLNYGKGLPARDRIKGEIPVYGSAGIVGYHNKPIAKGPGIIVGRKGSIGEIYFSKKDYYPIDTSYYINSSDKYDIRFIYYLLKQLNLKTLNTDAAVPGLNRSVAYQQKVLIPILSVQKSIAGILLTYDDLIENDTRRIRILEQMARAIYTEWFVNFRFPGHEKVKMIDSGSDFGKIPEGWEIIKVGQLLERIQRKNKIKRGEYAREGEFPVIDQGKDLIGGYTSENESIYQENLPFIIFGDHTRILKYIDFPFACGADGTQLLSSNSERMPMTLFFYALQNIDLSNFHYARHFKFLKEKTVILPDQITASAFDDYVRPCRDLIKVLSDRNINLRKTRDLLLPKLVTGEINI